MDGGQCRRCETWQEFYREVQARMRVRVAQMVAVAGGTETCLDSAGIGESI